MLNNITIKVKLWLLTIFTAVGMLILIGLNQQAISTAHNLGEAKALIEKLDIYMLELRKNEKNFLLRKDLKYLDKFKKYAHKIIKTKKELVYMLEAEGIDLPNVQKFIDVITNYENKFYDVVKIQQEIGLHPKDALYGSLRASVHKVQDYAKKSNDNALLASVYDLRKQEKDFMLRFDLKYVNKFKNKIDKLLQTDISDTAKSNLNSYKNGFLKLVDAETRKGLTANEGVMGEMTRSVASTSDIVHEMEKSIDEILESKTKALIIFDLSVAAVILVVIIGFIIVLGRTIASSLNNFQLGLDSFFKYLNREVDNVDTLKITGKDEINTMALTVNDNIQRIKNDISAERNLIDETTRVLSQYEQGDFATKISSQTNNQSLNNLVAVINQMGGNIQTNINNILNVLEEYSNSKYTNSVDKSNLKADFEKLANGVNELGDSISKLLKNSLDIGLTLEGSSNTLIDNVNQLNTSSNETAASLEETAAALEQVTSTIINSAENVAQMNNYANELNSSAQQGQTQAQNTSSAMDDITEQVTLISDSISIIDQIAFQTNILSLNAAVEAATAGEAGKGFAVVAQEVRNLASRSAEAAKEIKDLVENATSKASQGKDISSSMISGYDSLLDNITNATKKIEEIATASDEQKTGITQINDAITELDRQTQLNASIANQTQDIANQTDAIAKEIVEDVNTKEFIGKEQAKAKSKTELKSTVTAQKSVSSAPSQTLSSSKPTPKPVVQTQKPTPKPTQSAQVITPDNGDEDEWESF